MRLVPVACSLFNIPEGLLTIDTLMLRFVYHIAEGTLENLLFLQLSLGPIILIDRSLNLVTRVVTSTAELKLHQKC